MEYFNKFKKEELPSIEKFYSKLTSENITVVIVIIIMLKMFGGKK